MGSPLQRDQPAADKILIVALLLFMFAWLVLMGFDAKRFAWSSVPTLMQVLGALITLGLIWFSYRTMRENNFAAPVIKLQQERGQTVISTGPYAFVRHPMYFGAAFYFIGTALLLGSRWGVIFAFLNWSSSEGRRAISWASRSDGSGRNLKPRPFSWLR
jgi:protein-S-isoprenylcysteine O-methyltransferase Ste14